MFEKFIKMNRPTGNTSSKTHYTFHSSVNIEVSRLFEECGGNMIRKGLYRIHTSESSLRWSGIIGDYFQNHKDKIIPFGFDWAGRQYALKVDELNCLIMLDPATGETLTLNQNLVSFHNVDLVDDLNSFFDEEYFYKSLNSLHVNEIGFNNCIGHKIPLFLNGADAIENYEINDIEVYWEYQSQIYNQIKNLPPGTKINSIRFE